MMVIRVNAAGFPFIVMVVFHIIFCIIENFHFWKNTFNKTKLKLSLELVVMFEAPDLAIKGPLLFLEMLVPHSQLIHGHVVTLQFLGTKKAL